MPYRLILDGDNIIHRWTSCARIKDFEGKKSELIGLMSEYKDKTGEEVCIVFDAKDSYNLKREIKKIRGIEVIHTARGEIADRAIEDMVFKSKKHRNLIVVTSDNEIKIALASTSVPVYSTERFEEEILYELGDK